MGVRLADADRRRARLRQELEQGGLGWFIYHNRNELLTDKVFAGLATVILIGLVVEVVLFRTIEAVTVRRWGMQR
jgi:NitT/TauT family transport system permease protein